MIAVSAITAALGIAGLMWAYAEFHERQMKKRILRMTAEVDAELQRQSLRRRILVLESEVRVPLSELVRRAEQKAEDEYRRENVWKHESGPHPVRGGGLSFRVGSAVRGHSRLRLRQR